MNETFEHNLKILDEWTYNNEIFRLVNYGCGPNVLEEYIDMKWKEVSMYYKWSIITNRICLLKKEIPNKIIELIKKQYK